jgi:hypothetical protein
MENAVIRYEEQPLTAAEIKAQVQRIQQILDAVMVKDVHYGTIPGTQKPTLYKPGSEKILTTFRIAAVPKEVDDLSTADEIRYRVKVHGVHQTTGITVGVGIGECSSDEEKYKWRRPVCDEEFNETPEDRKRLVWKKYQGKATQQKQIRTNPADVANTILKMAKKRAQIDMTLTATAASDVFDQDLEDLPEGIVQGVAEQRPPIQEPQKKATSNDQTISEAQRKRFYAIAKGAGYSDDEIKKHLLSLGIEHTADIKKDEYDDLCEWAKGEAREPGEEG